MNKIKKTSLQLKHKTKKIFNNINNIFEDREYIAFYDSEFNAYDDKSNISIPQELVSVGLCIIDKKNNTIETYYSLIKLTLAKKITHRCKEITGIKNSDMKNAKYFIEVANNIKKIIQKYNIKKIFCYGNEDKKIFDKTAEIYNEYATINFFENKFIDIREIFKSKTKNKLGDQGLTFLKKVCQIEGKTSHNALNDAIDLSNIFNVIYNIGYDKNLYEILSKEREDISNYKRAKNIKDGQCIIAPPDIIKAKFKIIQFLKNNNILGLNDGTKLAIIDDLNELLVENNEK